MAEGGGGAGGQHNGGHSSGGPSSLFRSQSQSQSVQRESPSSRGVYDDEDDMMDNDHRSLGEASAMHARNVLSKMRSAVRTPIRNDYRIGRSLLASSPGRRQQESSGVYLDQEDSLFGAQPLPPPTTTTTTPPELAYDAHGGGGGGDARSRYKVLGMMEELKMKEKETNLLRRELNEMELNREKEALKHEKEALLYHRELTQMQMKQEELLDQETSQLQRNMNEMRRKQEELREKEKAQLRREMAEMQSTHENESALLHREIHEMQTKHEEDVTTIRTKLVATFKDDMHEMKTEWEEAFKRLKEESDTTQRAMSMELNDSARAKAEVETQLAEYRTMIEDERQRFAVNQQLEMEELKK